MPEFPLHNLPPLVIIGQCALQGKSEMYWTLKVGALDRYTDVQQLLLMKSHL